MQIHSLILYLCDYWQHAKHWMLQKSATVAHDTFLYPRIEYTLDSQHGAVWYSKGQMVPECSQLSSSLSHQWSVRVLNFCVDSCPSIWGGNQDEMLLAQVVSQIRLHEAVY